MSSPRAMEQTPYNLRYCFDEKMVISVLSSCDASYHLHICLLNTRCIGVVHIVKITVQGSSPVVHHTAEEYTQKLWGEVFQIRQEPC